MSSDSVVRARIDSNTKARAIASLDAMGFSVSDAIRLLMFRIADEQRLPFLMQVPNAKTVKPWKPWKPGRVSGLTTNRIFLTIWGCDADPGAIDVVQKGREKGLKMRQRFGQTEGAAQSSDLSGVVTRGVSGSPVTGELEGVRGPDWLLLYRVDDEELQLV